VKSYELTTPTKSIRGNKYNTKACFEQLKENRTTIGNMMDQNTKTNTIDNNHDGKTKAISKHIPLTSGNKSFDKILNQNFRSMIQKVRQQKQNKENGEQKQLSQTKTADDVEKTTSHRIAQKVNDKDDNDVCDDQINGTTTKHIASKLNCMQSNSLPNGDDMISSSSHSDPMKDNHDDAYDDNDNAGNDTTSKMKTPKKMNMNTNDGGMQSSSLKRDMKAINPYDKSARRKRVCYHLESLITDTNTRENYRYDDVGVDVIDVDVDDGNNHDSDHRPGINTKKSSTSSAWNCALCTFLNEKHTSNHAVCEMCEARRQSSSRISASSSSIC
jgi:hypothetical protein